MTGAKTLIFDSDPIGADVVSLASLIESRCDEDTNDDIDALAIRLASIREARSTLAHAYKITEKQLCHNAGKRKFEVEGLGEIVVTRGVKRTKWKKDELVPQIVARIVDDPHVMYSADGDLHPVAVIAQNVVVLLKESVSFGDGKVTGLRKLGFQIDEWCLEEPQAWTVTLPKIER